MDFFPYAYSISLVHPFLLLWHGIFLKDVYFNKVYPKYIQYQDSVLFDLLPNEISLDSMLQTSTFRVSHYSCFHATLLLQLCILIQRHILSHCILSFPAYISCNMNVHVGHKILVCFVKFHILTRSYRLTQPCR